MHSCILRVNNLAKDFCTKSSFYSIKTGKINELWRLAEASLGWCCKACFGVKQCRKKNLESQYWPISEIFKLPLGNLSKFFCGYFIWEFVVQKSFKIMAFVQIRHNDQLLEESNISSFGSMQDPLPQGPQFKPCWIPKIFFHYIFAALFDRK